MIKTIYGLTVDYSGWAKALEKQVDKVVARESADELEKKVVENLKLIATFGAGKAVLAQLEDTHKAITIKSGSEGLTKPLNPAAATLKGAEVRHCGTDKPGQKVSPAQTGLGGGSDVDLHYHPNDLTCSGGVKCTGNLADEVLLHELTHALRFAAGKSHCRPMTGKYKSYGTEEEFYAIVITNIYLSEKGNTSLRADHGFSLGVLDAEEQKHFASRHRDKLAKLKTQQSLLFEALSRVEPQGGFNPIGQMK